MDENTFLSILTKIGQIVPQWIIMTWSSTHVSNQIKIFHAFFSSTIIVFVLDLLRKLVRKFWHKRNPLRYNRPLWALRTVHFCISETSIVAHSDRPLAGYLVEVFFVQFYMIVQFRLFELSSLTRSVHFDHLRLDPTTGRLPVYTYSSQTLGDSTNSASGLGSIISDKRILLY